MARRMLCAGVLTVLCLLSPTSSAGQWAPVNGPYLTLLWGVSPHPDLPDELLVGTASGIYRSTNRGSTYQRVWGPYYGEYFYRHPRNPELIWTTDLHSRDGGRTWESNPNPVRRITASPSNPDLMCALVPRGNADQQWLEVVISTDRGQTFQTRGVFGHVSSAGLIWLVAQYLGIDAADSRVLYCLVGSNRADKVETILYKSTNEGRTWQALEVPDNSLSAAACDPVESGVVFLMTANKLFVSTDGGGSWDDLFLQFDGAWFGSNSPSPKITINPNGNGEMWLKATSELWHSADGGGTWAKLSNPPQSPLSWSGEMALAPVFNLPGQIYVNGEYTLHLSEDGGRTWKPIALPRLPANLNWEGSLAVDPGDARRVYAGLVYGPVFATRDSGNTWDTIYDRQTAGERPTGVFGIVVDPRNPAHIYLLSRFDKLQESRDFGATWRQASGGANIRSNAVLTLFSPDDFNTLYLGSAGAGVFDRSDSTSWGEVFVSRDAGSTWSKLPFRKPSTNIAGIAVKPGIPDTLVVITNLVEIFRSVNGGNDWDLRYSLPVGWFSNQAMHSVRVDPQHPDLIAVGLGSTLVVSEDFGKTWTARTPSAVASSGSSSVLITHPLGFTRMVVAHGAADGNLDYSDDLGRTWASFPTGILDALGVLAAADDGTFYATSSSSGVVKGRLDVPFFSSVSMRFDSTQVNSEARQTLTVYNPGIAPMTIPSIAVKGRHANQFRVSPTTVTVGPGQSQAITVTFAPLSAGPKTAAALSIVYDAQGSTTTVALNGVGGIPPTQQGPAISLSPPALAFDSTNVGSSSQKSFTVTNTGTASLSIANISVTGTNAGQFRVSSTAATVAAGRSDTLTVTFAPTSVGAKTASLSLTHNAAGSPSSLSLKGNGVTPSPAILLSATSLAFAPTQTGTASQKTLAISNPGTASLSITNIAVTGTDAGQFRVSRTTATVAAGKSDTLTVTFAPASAGAKTASLSIAHNATGNAATVGLSGVGVETPGYITTIAEAPSRGIAVDGRGYVYVAGYGVNHRVLRVSPEGNTMPFAGTGQAGFSGDGGPAIQARLNNPHDVAVDPLEVVYIAEYGGHRVRRVSPEGIITTIAGTGQAGFSGDGGPATQARLNSPAGIAVDPKGNVYIAEYGGHRVRRVSPEGIIITIAGTSSPGYSGDGGPATQARLSNPDDVVLDAAGAAYITEEGNHRVRRVSPEGIITTFAGTGEPGYSGDGSPATQARLHNPTGIAVDTRGNVYISEWVGFRVRQVSPEGIITTFAGMGVTGYSGDGGPANQAKLRPYGLAVDTQGNVYIADDGNGRIRKVIGGGVTPSPAIRLSATSLAFEPTQTSTTSQQTFTVTNIGTASLSITSITVTGADAGQFRVSRTTDTVAAGRSDTLTVTFAPTAAGPKSASLSLTHNAPGSPSSLSLAGNGISLTTIRVGQTKTQTLSSSSEAQYYALTVSVATPVAIDLTSATFDTFLRLYKGSRVSSATPANLLESNDNADSGSNSRLRRSLSPGTYMLTVSSLSGAGAYTLSVRRDNPLDVNSDGRVNTADATLVVRIILGEVPSTSRADVNSDGKVDVRDVLQILQALPAAKLVASAGSGSGPHLSMVPIPGSDPDQVEVALRLSEGVLVQGYGLRLVYAGLELVEAAGQAVPMSSRPGEVFLAAVGQPAGAELVRLRFRLLDRNTPGRIEIPEGMAFDRSGEIRGLPGVQWEQVRSLPSAFSLLPNHPNPFNPSTHIGYQLPVAGEVSLVIYNLVGQAVRVLVQDHQEAGYYQVVWDGTDGQGQPAASGVYFYRLVSGNMTVTRRMLLLK